MKSQFGLCGFGRMLALAMTVCVSAPVLAQVPDTVFIDEL